MKFRLHRYRTVGAAALLAAVLAATSACTSTGAETSAAQAASASSSSALVSARASSMPEITIASPATTPVPAPQSGDINSTVPAVPVTTMPAVAVSKTAALSDGVDVQVQKVAPITGVAQGPGEVGGAAAAVTIQVTNNSGNPVVLNQVQVTAQDKSGRPTPSVSGQPAAAMTGSLAPGQVGTGVYVFTLGNEFRNPLMISISYAAGAPVVLFTADVSK